MANENWEEESKIHEAFKPVFNAIFEVERKLTPSLRQRLFQVRCQAAEVATACCFQVREAARDGSTVWLYNRPKCRHENTHHEGSLGNFCNTCGMPVD